RKCFEQVYARIPGETGPKLALAFAAESDGDIRCAVRLYDTVSRTSPATTSAAFGLARCAIGLGERQRTLDAYRRVPHGARSWVKARVETVRVLISERTAIRRRGRIWSPRVRCSMESNSSHLSARNWKVSCSARSWPDCNLVMHLPLESPSWSPRRSPNAT